MVGDSSSLTTRTASIDDEISAVHPDVIRTHILTRLDGPALASAASASSMLHHLSTEENLWLHICNREWPSTAEPRLRDLISTFPSGHRSFFSDSFPTLQHRVRRTNSSQPAGNVIAAVDISYKNDPIYSKVQETQTETMVGLELCSQFRIDLLDPKETIPVPSNLDYRDNACESDLGENLSVSWILIDPTRKRSGNFSSSRPVLVDRNWLTGDIQLRFATVLAGDRAGEFVQCVVMVTCGGRGRGDLHVREVSLQVEDIEGKQLTWKDSLVILKQAIEKGERRKKNAAEEKEWYELFVKMKRERRERKRRGETRLELACIASAVSIFVAFWVFVTVRFFQLLQLFCGSTSGQS
ncbi:hypothetical protein NMG60_11033425 [Bertholletia excelsa]